MDEWMIKEGAHPAIVGKHLFDRAKMAKQIKFGGLQVNPCDMPYPAPQASCTVLGWLYTSRKPGLS